MATPKKLAVSTKPVESNDAPSTDQVTDLLCDLCIHDDETVDATAFCNDCEQYLCTSCQRVHQRGTATKQHEVVKGRSNLPKPNKTKPKEPPNVKDTSKASKDMNAVYLEQLAVGSDTDKYYAQVNARETMIDGSILVCDYGNYKLKYYDADGDFLNEISLSSEPYGMAQLSSTEVIVTLPKESHLQIVKIKSGSRLGLGKKLKTKLRCEKILKYYDELINDEFLVVAYDDMYYCIIRMVSNGKILESLYSEPKQSLDIFESYYEIALSPDQEILYVTNKKSGLLGMSLKGEIVLKYQEPGEDNHYGVSIDPEGKIYIACYDNDKIVIVNKNGEKVKDLVSLKDMRPSYVEYNAKENKLYVGQSNSNKILCYHTTH